MTKRDFVTAFLAVFIFVGGVQSLYDPHRYDEQNRYHGNNLITDESPKAECPTDFTGLVAYAFDCRQFLNCWHGRGSVQSCPPGTMFNPRNLECDHPSKVKCQPFDGFAQQSRRSPAYGRSQRQQQSIQCEQGASGLFAHPYDCTKFLNCDHGRTFIQECGPGTMFNDLFKVCDWPHKVDCGDRSATGENLEEPRQEEVHYGEGQMDVRSNFGAENIKSNGRSFSSSDNQNKRRYPNPSQQSENNHFNGLNSYGDNSFSSTANGQSFTSQNPSPSFASSKSWSAFDSTLELPQETQAVESKVPLSNAYGPINPNQLGNDDSLDQTKTGGRKGRIDDIRSGNQNREFPTAKHNQPTFGFEINAVDTKNTQPPIKVPELQLLSPRVADDFGKYFSNPKPKVEIPSTTTIRNIVMLDGEPVTKKVKTIYPSGFEKLGEQCDETGSGMDEHPSDCTKFVTCENGRMHVHSCDIGFSFNPTLKICDFAPNVPTCLYDSGITIPAVPVASEQDALNEIHDDERIEKSTAVNQFTQAKVNPYFIPDMSVLPLETKTNPPYPKHQTIPTEHYIPMEGTYFGFGKPSRGGDVEAESLDEIVSRVDAERIEPTTARNGKGLRQNEIHDSTITTFTTTEKQSVNIMRIPAGKEHARPLYHRPTKPSFITTSTTTAAPKPYSPLQNNNHLYYQPFAKQSKDVEEPEQDYVPISEALKLLLRPYISRNETKATNETINKEPMEKIENKLFDLMDNKQNGQTQYNKSLEQDDLALALLNENVAVKHLPVTTFRPENRIDVESVPLNFVEQKVQTPAPIPPTKPFHHHHHPPPLLHNSHSPFSPSFKNSPEFHKNHPHINSNNNKIIFPGPQHEYNHPMHANRLGGVAHSSNHFAPPMVHNSHQNHNSNHHPPTQQLSNRHNAEQTTQTTASAPIPNQYPMRPTTAIRSGRFETNTNQNCEFSCGNGKCVQLRQLCDGRNDCGNRYDELHCPQVNYQVRLSNDKGHKHMGRVEVRAYGKWGYVCDDKFTITNANVLCRELGFNMGAAEVKPNSFYPSNVNVPITESSFMMDEVTCQGNETSLKECDFDGWQVSDCNAEEVVGVVCKVTVMQCPPNHWLCQTSEECIPMSFMCDGLKDCSDGTDESDMHCKAKIEYRLMDGNDELEGRIEVKYRGVWGTVCDDDFGDKEATVFCNSLGFNGPATVFSRRIGMSSGPIWLDQVNCIGNETSLDQCMHFDWSESNCNHTEDVSVRCSYGSDAKSSRYIADEYVLQHLTNDETNEYSRHPRNNKHIPIPDYSNQCGRVKISNADAEDSSENIGQFRVISGSKTKRGHHPWQATIRARSQNGRSSHWCGAVIVSKNHILTAAHCLIGFPKGAYFVRLGDHHSEIYENSEIEIFIENWSIHEDFRKGQLMNNDIALIQLKHPIQFTNYIQPICLPTKETKFEAGKNCTISGWGSIQYGKSTPSLDLKAASVPLISQEVCRQKEIYGDEIMDTMFCAGYLSSNGVDACDGDSGGPLVCANKNGVNELYGIISWGQRCGDSTKPGVYVNVMQYLDWIKEKMSQLSQKV